MPISGVLFDLFDTLIRSDVKTPSSISHSLLAAAKPDGSNLPLAITTNDTNFDVLFDRMGIPSTKRKKILSALQTQLDTYQLVEGATGVLDELKNRGLKLGLVSNLQPGAEAVVDRLDLKKYFDGIFYSFREGTAKPDPTAFWGTIAKMTGSTTFNPAEFVMVGDTLKDDVFGGLAAGLNTYWVDHNQRSADQTLLAGVSEFINRHTVELPTHGGRPIHPTESFDTTMSSDRKWDAIKGGVGIHLGAHTKDFFNFLQRQLSNLGFTRSTTEKPTTVRIIELNGSPQSQNAVRALRTKQPEGSYQPTLAMTHGNLRSTSLMGNDFINHFFQKAYHFGLKLGHEHIDRSDDDFDLRDHITRLATPTRIPYWKRLLGIRGLPRGGIGQALTLPASFMIQDSGAPFLSTLDAALVSPAALPDYIRASTAQLPWTQQGLFGSAHFAFTGTFALR